jgi:hypothetical protein
MAANGNISRDIQALTSRVAYLVQHHHLLPTEICAVTFTNKAAKEMKERLSRLIGEDQSKKLVMGTLMFMKEGRILTLSRHFPRALCSLSSSLGHPDKLEG